MERPTHEHVTRCCATSARTQCLDNSDQPLDSEGESESEISESEKCGRDYCGTYR
jgi:hypothetical protein